MKKTFKLNGLDCANCAQKIQDGICKLDGVIQATVNFMTTKLVIDAEAEKMDAVVEAAKAIIKRLEPDVEMNKA